MTTRQAIWDGIDTLPAVSAATPRLVSMLNDPDVSVNAMEEVIRLDPGLTGNLLRMANSAYFGLSGRVGSVRQAVVLLGMHQVSELVLASAVRPALHRPVAGYDMTSEALWLHCLSVGVASERLAALIRIPEQDLAFAAGLLHDIGKVVIGVFVAEQLEAIADLVSAEHLPFDAAERQVLGADHAEIGAEVLARWNLPDEMITAVRYHHDPAQAPETTPLSDVVHIGDTLSLMIGFGHGLDELNYRMSPAAVARLHLATGTVEAVVSDTLEETQRLAVSCGAAAKGEADGL